MIHHNGDHHFGLWWKYWSDILNSSDIASPKKIWKYKLFVNIKKNLRLQMEVLYTIVIESGIPTEVAV
jgi:hypothetical protein